MFHRSSIAKRPPKRYRVAIVSRKFKILLIAIPACLVVAAIGLAPMIIYTLVKPERTVIETHRLRSELQDSDKITPESYTPSSTNAPAPKPVLGPELDLEYGYKAPALDPKGAGEISGELIAAPDRLDALSENAGRHAERYLNRETDDLRLNSRLLDPSSDLNVGVALDKQNDMELREIEISKGKMTLKLDEKNKGLKLQLKTDF